MEKSLPNRRWFQIHLTTAIMLMFIAAWMIWANTVERQLSPRMPGFTTGIQPLYNDTLKGWPFAFGVFHESWNYSMLVLVADLGFCVVAILLITLVWERLIYLCERKVER